MVYGGVCWAFGATSMLTQVVAHNVLQVIAAPIMEVVVKIAGPAVADAIYETVVKEVGLLLLGKGSAEAIWEAIKTAAVNAGQAALLTASAKVTILSVIAAVVTANLPYLAVLGCDIDCSNNNNTDCVTYDCWKPVLHTRYKS